LTYNEFIHILEYFFLQARDSQANTGCHSSSSSGVSSDLSSEESYPRLSTMRRENTGRSHKVKVRNNLSNPPPKPARQFLTPYKDNDSKEDTLYAGNRTYQEMENREGR
jgi:hypothetical protein